MRREVATLAEASRRTGPEGTRRAKAWARTRLAKSVWLPHNHRDPTHGPHVSEVRPADPGGRFMPLEGKQELFLRADADIVVFGGAAGGSKSVGLLLDALRHIHLPRYRATLFRQTYAQIMQSNGLWDQASRFYPALGGVPRKSEMAWVFPSGAKVKFAHLQYESSVTQYQGGELDYLGLDEGTHYSEYAFWYLQSRSRSTVGMRTATRITCNPDADSWLANFIAWWIDEATGYPIPERAGQKRWFVRLGEQLEWDDSWEALTARFPDKVAAPGDYRSPMLTTPRSVTFIPSKLADNYVLTESDPQYRSALLSLPQVERERLLEGNWKIRPAAGKVFNRAWFSIVGAVPAGGEEVRFWDFACTEAKLKGDDPDFTAGVKVRRVDGVYYVVDVLTMREGPAEVERAVLNTAQQDREAARSSGTRYRVGWEEEPGSASKFNTRILARLLDGFECRRESVSGKGDKLQRAAPFASQACAGNVKLLAGRWNEGFLKELHNVPDSPHDDQMDGAAGAYTQLAVLRRVNIT